MEDLIVNLPLRAIGSAGGAFIALVIVHPDTMRGLASRLSVSFLSGIIFAPKIGHYFHWQTDADDIVAAACVASACSWWIWHTIIACIQSGWLPFLARRNGK